MINFILYEFDTIKVNDFSIYISKPVPKGQIDVLCDKIQKICKVHTHACKQIHIWTNTYMNNKYIHELYKGG